MGNYYEYYKFNKEVYNQFFAPNIGSNYHVAYLLAEISKIKEWDCFTGACKYLKENWWSSLNKETNGIPDYLGLIAIQILALTKRETVKYNAVLCSLLNITEPTLQNKYSKDKAQENIYEKFEKWCKEKNLGVSYIAKTRRKYVRFPLSFPILTAKDHEKLRNLYTNVSKK